VDALPELLDRVPEREAIDALLKDAREGKRGTLVF
jgi:hypothetical protein